MDKEVEEVLDNTTCTPNVHGVLYEDVGKCTTGTRGTTKV